MFLAEMALLGCPSEISTDLDRTGWICFLGDYSYFAPGNAILRDLRFLGHKIVLMRLAFFDC